MPVEPDVIGLFWPPAPALVTPPLPAATADPESVDLLPALWSALPVARGELPALPLTAAVDRGPFIIAFVSAEAPPVLGLTFTAVLGVMACASSSEAEPLDPHASAVTMTTKGLNIFIRHSAVVSSKVSDRICLAR